MASTRDVRMMGQRGADKREMLLGNSMFGRLLARRWRAASVLAPTLADDDDDDSFSLGLQIKGSSSFWYLLTHGERFQPMRVLVKHLGR